MEFEPQWESGKIMQTVRKRNRAPSKSAPALDCNPPFPSSERGGPGIPLADAPTRRDRVRMSRKEGVWYAGRVRTPTKEKERGEGRGREGWLIQVDCGSAKTAKFPGWLAS